MMVLRNVFQATYGQGGRLAAEIAAGQKEMAPAMGQRRWRVMTDFGGPFDTVVLEVEVESLAEWEQIRPKLFQDSRFQESMARAVPLIAHGRSEFWTVEAEG